MEARKILLKDTGENGQFKYRQLLEVMLSRPLNPQAGMQMPEIRRCNKILDKLEKADGAVLVTPEEWQFLKDRIESFTFGVGGKLIEQFAADVAAAELCSLKEQ